MQIYVDGVLRAERRFPAAGLRDLGGNLQIGAGLQHGDFNGQIAELRLWDRALAAGEVDRAMRRGLVGAEPGMFAHYTFAAIESGGDIRDFSGHGHHGVLRGDAHLDSLHIAQIVGPSPIQVAADVTIMALAHHDDGVRRRAVQSLDRVGRLDFNRVMEVALRHDDSWIRRHAAAVLAMPNWGSCPRDPAIARWSLRSITGIPTCAAGPSRGSSDCRWLMQPRQ
jgi:hypothetical protein